MVAGATAGGSMTNVPQIEQVPIEAITNNDRNPRTIKTPQLEQLKRSLAEFPDMLKKRPIAVRDGVVIGGNMRLRAARELGWKYVWVVRCDDLTDEQARRFVIADNVQMGEWDFDLLANEWDDLPLADWGVEAVDVMTNNEDYAGLDQASKLEKFMGAEIKRIVLFYSQQELEIVTAWLEQQCQANGDADFPAVLLRLANESR